MPRPHGRRPNRPVQAVAASFAILVALTGTWWFTVHRPPAVTDPAVVVPPPAAPLLPGAPVLAVPVPAAPASVPLLGYDVSHPQCGRPLPTDGGFAIVGITGGRPLSSNRCVGVQITWAAGLKGHAVYLNTGYTGTGDPVAYGRRVVQDAIVREHASGHSGTSVWWLDVETVNTWAGTTQQNATVIDAMAARLQQLGVRVGIYSTPNMWVQIAGTWQPWLPVWYATGPGTRVSAAAACTSQLAGQAPAIVQWVQRDRHGELDHNLICPAYAARAADLLDLG